MFGAVACFGVLLVCQAGILAGAEGMGWAAHAPAGAAWHLSKHRCWLSKELTTTHAALQRGGPVRSPGNFDDAVGDITAQRLVALDGCIPLNNRSVEPDLGHCLC